MPASFRSPPCCEPGPSMTEPGPRNDRDFGVRHRWLLALAIPASPSSAWPCLGWALTAPGAERPHPPQPHPPQVPSCCLVFLCVTVGFFRPCYPAGKVEETDQEFPVDRDCSLHQNFEGEPRSSATVLKPVSVLRRWSRWLADGAPWDPVSRA